MSTPSSTPSRSSPVRAAASRHRPSERLAPRESDRIALRFAMLAAWAERSGVSITIDGRAIDAASIAEMARAESAEEERLAERWRAFQEVYVPHTARVREGERLLLRLLDEIERSAGGRIDASSRALLRACRLRRPPKAWTEGTRADAPRS